MPLIRNSPSPVSSGPSGTQDIRHLLTQGDVNQRWDAARAAPEFPDGLQLLISVLPTESDLRVRGAIFTSVAKIGSVEAAAQVLPYLHSDDAQLRTQALDALRAMPAATAHHLPSLLSAADPDVRLLACDLVRGQPAAEAGRLLADVLINDREANVCAAAVEVLAETGGPGVAALLDQCARRFPEDPFLSFAIRAAGERLAGQH
jgi:HEAT repeat protein